MAEKQESKVTRAKFRAFEKKKSDVSRTSVERADESAETGYSSAPHSSDILSGPDATSESAVWTSEDHGAANVEFQEPPPVTKKQQKKPKGQKKQIEVSESDLKLERGITRSPDKTCRTRLQKKSAAQKQTADDTVKCSQKSLLAGCHPQTSFPVEDAAKPPKDENTSQKKSKSPKKSILQKLRSQSRSGRSEAAATSSQGAEGSTKVDESKQVVCLQPEICTPVKRGRRFKLLKINPVRKKLSKVLDLAEAGPKMKEKVKGSKKGTKASFKTISSPTKQGGSEIGTPAAEEPQQPSMMQSFATTCERVSSGIQSIQLTKPKKDRVLLLSLDESMDSASSDCTSGKTAVGAGKETEGEKTRAEGGARLRSKAWRPQHAHQEGGFQTDVIWATFSSSAEDTGTEMSLVSDSSAIQGGSESKKGASSSTDSLSEIPGMKEEDADGQEIAKKSLLHGHKRVKDKESSDTDEDSKAFRAICGSPVKKIAPQRKSTENSSDE